MASLCLNMIVKNESHVIEETLECLCKYFKLDYWVISDTGSTDNTIEIIERFFKNKNISGEIHQEPWRDFAYNRNKALQACEGKADYVLFFDADDLIEGNLALPSLEADAYYLKFTNEESLTDYTRALIVRNNGSYYWKSVLHEVIVTDKKNVKESIIHGDYYILSRRKGNRNLNPKKELDDALVLENAFIHEEDDILLKARYAFYCGQSYRVYASKTKDPQYLEKSYQWYKTRTEIELDGIDIDDEIYNSYEQLGLISYELGNISQAIKFWNEGTYLDPDRAECWYWLANYHHRTYQTEQAYRYIKQCIDLPPDFTRIFINRPIYDYLCLYEHCLISWKLRKINEAYSSFKKVLPILPKEYIKDLAPMVKSFRSLLKVESASNISLIQERLKQLDYSGLLESRNIPTLCLNMIVKNEKHVVAKTLECLCNYIDFDYWVISDTGSSDNTMQIIQDFFDEKGIPGELVQHEWKDFAHNRNLALDACEGKADYVLFFDADDLIEGNLRLPVLEHDAYYLKFTEEDYSVQYRRCCIVKNNQEFKWEGVLHESIKSKTSTNYAYVEGDYSIISIHRGSRNLDPNKTLKDALILENAFHTDNHDAHLSSRYAFYCAQSYMGLVFKDKKYINKAIEWYEKRLEFQPSDTKLDDESYLCHDVLGELFLKKKNVSKAIYYWEKATQLNPERAECWYHLANYYRHERDYSKAYNYIEKAILIEFPKQPNLFLRNKIYEYGSWFEYAIISGQLGKIEQSYLAFKKVIEYLPAKFIIFFNPLLKMYEPYLKSDTSENIKKIKFNLTKMGRPNYLREFNI